MRPTNLIRSDRGTIILIVLITVFIIAGISAAMLGQVQVNRQRLDLEVQQYRAFEVAEAGVAEQMASIFAGNGPGSTSTTNVGPITFNGGSYTAVIDAVWGAGADRISVTSTGTFNGTAQTVSAEFSRSASQINEAFLKAIYAGNSSEVPANTTQFNPTETFAYDMKFSGGVDDLDSSGPTWDGDLVNGDVYAAGNISRSDEARLNGEVKGSGVLTMNGQGQSSHTAVGSKAYVKPPNLIGMDYANNADFKITTANSSSIYASKSGYPGKVANKKAGLPYHIFTKNRGDMAAENNSTPGQDDYYLEDLMTDSQRTYDDMIDPGVTDKTIYIEGNVWIHNKSVIEFEWAKNTRLTIVVKGNLYISDDIRYDGPYKQHAQGAGDANSMVAFIALKDPNFPNNSGDIVLGDPRYGTVDYMDGVFYAEGNFRDQNLSNAAAATFEIFGGMLAGDQVLINRDYTLTQTTTIYVPTLGYSVTCDPGDYHSEMYVHFDTRLLDPNFNKPPQLPSPESGVPAGAWVFLGWRRGA